MVRYAVWIARRWNDPAFRIGWPQFADPDFWRRETEDLEEQLAAIRGEAGPALDRARRELGTEPAIELTNKEPTENSRGLRFGNMVQIRDVVSEEIEAALAGQKPAKDALDSAVTRSNQILRQFERSVSR